MRLFRKILLTIIFGITTLTLYAQNEIESKEEVKGYINMKEFEDDSFKDAMPTVIKDSSILFQHLFGVKYGYSVNNIYFNQDIRTKAIYNPINFGVYYTYLHSLWSSMPYFGIQVGFEKSSIGTNVFYGEEDSEDEIKVEYNYNTYTLPLTTQFRTDISIIRLMVNAGGYAYYISSEANGAEVPTTTNRYGYGLTGGGGIAVKFHPIEIHLECNYRYSLSNIFDNQIFSDTYWTFTHATQLQFSVGLFYNFTKKNK